ncbi:neural cell adhesion molecule 2 [Bradysia coprophila]|uniref:neural cell adhesion molecule 2 n=1 Tax=Bradysia coprophila TaxID=38358 RepID=UPI00187DD7FC|nr:neural cell adhesion molecule 2 [Bradysia coprophila]
MPIQWMCLLLFSVEIKMILSLNTRSIEDENVPIMQTEAVQSAIGRLPCNVTPPVAEDKITLVIWYKEMYSTPIYSFDARDSNLEKGSHWVDDKTLGGRAYFQAAANPATLTIESMKSIDSGIYRCRVDFLKSPTRNSRVQLKVIIPPEKLLVLDERGDHIPHYILGPYNEGSTVNISCVSMGGRPLPIVTWWHEGTLLDDTSQVLSEKRVKNVLQLKKLERRHLHMVFTCQASNNNVTNPISSSVTLDMNLRPLWVKLQGENRPLSADNTYNLVCEVCGSRPAPVITWWKGSMPMRNTREEISQDGNNTKSILSFTPTIDDRGKFLSCRAEQSLIPDSGIEDGWKLDIYHTPVVTLEFGTNLNSTSIREGADVYFECNIKSNPWVYRVSWRHNGKALDNSVPEGIIVANQSLVLQNVSRARSGLYTCVGSNREGDGESTINVNIKFPPVCRPGQKNIYSTGRHETAKVVCEVEANPYDITFHWKFNKTHNALEFVDIPSSHVAVDRLKSTAHYTPLTEHDYGTLLCWGSNEIGTQMEPCVYNIIPAGRPDSLTNCTILNQTYNGFQIECIEGFDGGLPQDFVIEVYTVGNRQNPIIIKSKVPYFELKNLNSGAGYNVFMIAQNRKGRSNSTVLQVYTLKNPEKQTDLSLASGPAIENMKPFLAILLGIVGGMMFIAIVIVFIVRMRGSSGRDRNNCETTTYTTTTTTMQNGQRNVQTTQDMGLARNLCNDSVESIEKNPDIIPQGNKLDDKDEDEKGFEWINNSNHPRMYATAAVAEQNLANSTSTYNPFNINSQNCTSLKQQQQHQQQQQHHAFPTSQHQTFITNYSTMVPHSKYNHIHKDLTYAELSAASPTQRIPYATATLGRPSRTADFKRHEPTIYAQIDLAHPHTMYATSPMYVTSSATGVTMSHPSQLLTTFPPPPLFANNPTNNLINNPAIPPACFAEMHKTSLQPVPEVPASTCTGSLNSDDKGPTSGTRF